VKGLPIITKVHAWIVIDDDGTEGIAGVMLPTMGMTPLMCGDMPGAVAAMDRMAQEVARETGKDVHHYVFDSRCLDKVIHP
jgi:hypothetical protein